jgi:hypothetical protein
MKQFQFDTSFAFGGDIMTDDSISANLEGDL